MKDYKCAHCAHCNEIKYDGFFCDMSGYIEHKRIEDDCPDFEVDTIDRLAKLVTEKLIAAYPKGAEFTAVRHGRWIQTKLKGYYECSECRFEHSTNPNQRFCSYCGAPMSATDTNVGGKGGDDNV